MKELSALLLIDLTVARFNDLTIIRIWELGFRIWVGNARIGRFYVPVLTTEDTKKTQRTR